MRQYTSVELGLYGSEHYAQMADSLGWNIAGVLNFDMIAYQDNVLLDADIYTDANSQWLADLLALAASLYTSLQGDNNVGNSSGSDHWYFQQYGYPAIFTIEKPLTQWNPYYHSINDLLSTLSMPLATEMVKTGVATLGILGTYPAPPQGLTIRDAGTGGKLVLSWLANSETDLAGYKIHLGITSGNYQDTLTVGNITTDTLSGLTDGQTYYIALSAYDDDGHESRLSTEKTGVPGTVPLAPSTLTLEPTKTAINLTWRANTELDLMGYNIYRGLSPGQEIDTLNAITYSDTTYQDSLVSSNIWYYYVVTAVDSAGNESPPSNEVKGRIISLDQSILIVDETRNWTNPPDSLQDKFYANILSNYNFTQYEYDSLNHAPTLSDLGAYSTLLWHADDYVQLMAWSSVTNLKKYLDAGGNLWFVGWKPTANLMNNIAYPKNFSPGSFIYDYLKISQAELAAGADSFQSAVGMLGYPDITVDSTKVPVSSWSGTMRYIEALTPVAPAETIYTIDMKNNSSSFEGKACGVRYLGIPYKAVFFGFPLYFMKENEAKLVAQKVMDDFGEATAVEEVAELKAESQKPKLYQNYPNPFSSQTVIRYSLFAMSHEPSANSHTTLKIYNVAGQLVKTLVDEQRIANSEQRVIWDGKDESGKSVASGVYFYRLSADDFTATNKMILLR